jgi:hypothetical protein
MCYEPSLKPDQQEHVIPFALCVRSSFGSNGRELVLLQYNEQYPANTKVTVALGWAQIDQTTQRLLLYITQANHPKLSNQLRCTSNFWLSGQVTLEDSFRAEIGLAEGRYFLSAKRYPALHFSDYTLVSLPIFSCPLLMQSVDPSTTRRVTTI